MKIEKLSKDKLKIIFSLKELENENIDYHDFMAGSKKYDSIINNLLYVAKDELDFDTKGYNVEIETFEVNHGDFVITITKFESEADDKKKLKAKRRVVNFNNCSCIYEFENFDNYIDFANFLKTNFNKIFKIFCENSEHYSFKQKHLLIVNTNNFDTNDSRIFNSCITEFALFKSNSNVLITKIKESFENHL